MTELNINGLPLEGSSTIQLKFWSAQGGLLHSYNKRQEKLLGSNQVFDKSKRRIKWRGSYFFGQVWWFEQGTAKTLVGKTCSLSDSNWISVSSRSATMSFLPSPSTLEKGCLWTGGTGRHCETFCEVLIYFNRGWVPQSLGNASTRQEGQVGSDWSFFTFYIKISGDWWAGNIRSTPYNWANLQPDSEK